jgi:hypothetical protein
VSVTAGILVAAVAAVVDVVLVIAVWRRKEAAAKWARGPAEAPLAEAAKGGGDEIASRVMC